MSGGPGVRGPGAAGRPCPPRFPPSSRSGLGGPLCLGPPRRRPAIPALSSVRQGFPLVPQGFLVFCPKAKEGGAVPAPAQVGVAGLGQEAEAALELSGVVDLAALDEDYEAVCDGCSPPGRYSSMPGRGKKARPGLSP